MENKYDFIIIGAGVTGMAAAMYGARLGLKTLCLGASHGTELPLGGVITTTNVVENYPGFVKLTGEELADNIKKHALEYDLVSLKNEKVEKVNKKEKLFFVKTNKSEYIGKTILIATGTKWKKLEVPGAVEFENKGDTKLRSVVLDKEYNGKKELELDGLFIAIGHIALSDLAKDLGVILDKKSEIVIDHKTSETNIPGVYAAGDVADKPFKQAITGVAEGCTAAYSAYEYITKNYVEVS